VRYTLGKRSILFCGHEISERSDAHRMIEAYVIIAMLDIKMKGQHTSDNLSPLRI
jgi:hypothetical protein